MESHLLLSWLIELRCYLGNGSLAGVRNIHRAAVLENLLRSIALLAVLGTDVSKLITSLFSISKYVTQDEPDHEDRDRHSEQPCDSVFHFRYLSLMGYLAAEKASC